MTGARTQPFSERLSLRIGEAAASDAYRAYESARTHVLEMLDTAEAARRNSGAPSEYWAEESANIEYMFDASPLVVDRLRQHCYHLTGIWPYHYRTHSDRRRAQHAEKLRALLEVGPADLWVPESPLLGGFGFDLGRGLTNVDTLKFFEVMIALDRAETLGDFRSDERRVVWEIGAGWGGFAYVFKTLFPNTTYVVSDLPHVMLFSATYLMTLFPDARITFHPGDDTVIDDQTWWDSDFVFVPAGALDAVAPPRIDLAVNMVSFQEMTTEQVDAYMRHAHARGVPFLYSLNRERSNYNPDLIGVVTLLERYFWPHEIEVLPVTYQSLPDTIPPVDRKAKKLVQRGGSDASRRDGSYRHIVGWPRLD